MKAIVRHAYGSPDVLALEDIEQPAVADDGMLVRVRATSVNAFDWHMLRGLPYMTRLTEGLRAPRSSAMGVDVAGVVEAVGKDVSHVRPGDAVYGARSGAFAELVSGRTFVAMPAGLTFEEAAAVPVAATTALQAVRDQADVRPGQRVLVTGAGGGVGTFAVQIAKAFGGDVTATTSSAKLELIRSLGADDVVDYTRDDVTKSGRRFDAIIDVAGSRLRDLAHVLAPGGTIVMVGPGRGNWIGPVAHMAAAVVRTRLGRQRVAIFLARHNREDLLALKDLIEAGRLRPIVDRTFPLAEIGDAIRRVEQGKATGKVVVTI